jgi:hypothetical protein
MLEVKSSSGRKGHNEDEADALGDEPIKANVLTRGDY